VAYLPALVIAGTALLVLMIMVVVLLGPLRRFRVALAAYRARLDAEASLLQAGRDEIREQLDHVRRHDRELTAGTIGDRGKTEERNG
jgi:hypothetical protein